MDKPVVQEAQALQMICDKASNRELVRKFASLTPEKILGGNYPSLAALKKQHDVVKIESALAVIVAEVSVYFGNGFGSNMALDVAAEILSSYYYLTVEDCILVLNRLKRKTIYGKLTPNIVLSAFADYDTERTKLVNDNNYSKHLSHKEGRNEQSLNHVLRMIKKERK